MVGNVQKHERQLNDDYLKAPARAGELLTIAPGLRSQTLLPYGLSRHPVHFF
jgi:hypothetical protein